jgi:hypothetical protein
VLPVVGAIPDGRGRPRYKPRDHVRALVSGLPSPQRGKRLLVMLQAYLDNSGWDGASPVFVMAGYVAPEAHWESFSDDWQAVLDLETPRKLGPFKMNEAYRRHVPESQFYGWTEEQRDARLVELVKVINKHAMHGIVSVIPVEPYLKLFKGKFKPTALDRPYFLSFFGVLAELLKLTRDLKLDDRIDFYFEEEGGESKSLIQDQYDLCMSMAPAEIKNLVGGPPSFKKDEDLRPLQAADMYAWLVRRYYVDQHSGKAPQAHPSHQFLANLFYPQHDLLDIWSKDRLHEAHAALSLRINKLAWADRNKRGLVRQIGMTVPDPSSPFAWPPSEEQSS